MSKEYKYLDDIDLLIGALLEKHNEYEMVGPTMKCIILEQFIRARLGDRYFYDLPDVFSERKYNELFVMIMSIIFTEYIFLYLYLEQLTEIRKMSLSRLFCDNGNNIESMQLNAFFKPKSNNELLSCKTSPISKTNLIHWKENLEQKDNLEQTTQVKHFYPTFFFNGVG